MPSSVWKRSPRTMPAASFSIAAGWSPAGSKSDTTRKVSSRAARSVTPPVYLRTDVRWERHPPHRAPPRIGPLVDQARSGVECTPWRPRAFLPFTTERLTVRAMRPSDVTAFATYRNLPEVARYQDWELPYTRDLAHQLIDEMDGINGPVPGEWVQLAIDDIDGTLVGDLAVYRRYRRPHGDDRLHDEPRAPGTRLRDRSCRCSGRPALRPAARAPRRGDARSGERVVGPRARAARLQVRGAWR